MHGETGETLQTNYFSIHVSDRVLAALDRIGWSAGTAACFVALDLISSYVFLFPPHLVIHLCLRPTLFISRSTFHNALSLPHAPPSLTQSLILHLPRFLLSLCTISSPGQAWATRASSKNKPCATVRAHPSPRTNVRKRRMWWLQIWLAVSSTLNPRMSADAALPSLMTKT